MFTLRVALAGLIVVNACSRSAPEREAPASQKPPDQNEIASAKPPPAADSDLSRPHPTPQKPAKKPSISRVPKRKTTSARPQSSQPPGSASVPRVSPRPSESSDTSVSRDSGVSSDTMGYSSYPGTVSPPAPGAANVVAAGTVIHASLEDSISSRLDTYGKRISGKVMQNVTGPNGEVLVRAGTPLRLTVTRLGPGRGNGKGDLEIKADSITIKGRPQKLEAKIQSVPYELKGRGVTAEEAAKVGVGAAGGAVIGGVITGKTKGAVIGGVVGAAGGAAVASQTAAKDVVVKARTPVQMVLTDPLVTR
jgi:hypothetical protein